MSSLWHAAGERPPRARRRSTCPTASRAPRPVCRRTAADRDRAVNRRLAAKAGASNAAFTAALKLATSPASSAPATASDKIVSRETTLKSSPVMKVEKLRDRAVLDPHPFRMRAGHADQRLACGFAGRARRAAASPRRASRPALLVSRCAIPGRMRMSRASPGTRRGLLQDRPRAAPAYRHNRPRPSRSWRRPCHRRAPADDRAPRPRRDAIAARRQSRPWPRPSCLRRCGARPARRRALPISQSRKLLVPQSTAT